MGFGIWTDRVEIDTQGNSQVLDITPQVRGVLERRGLREGQVLVFVTGSTAAVTSTEFEPGLCKDLPAFFERIAPRSIPYHHDETWHDGNGHAHVRASALGPSLVVPVAEGRLLLGTWQQIVLIDFDTRPRRRQLVVQCAGQGEG
ncbi:MAG: hypothetical protein KatS3mg102_2321 [Planctomycetota bacterium]|nr:MAG: hypothetical protein KatS3mg102_2321 [Planctomycetota bacterium]